MVELIQVIPRSLKLVYFGPPRAGKRTTIEALHGLVPAMAMRAIDLVEHQGERFVSLAFSGERIAGQPLQIQLCCMTGACAWEATQLLTLQGADAVVFVADSSPERLAENVQARRRLADWLERIGLARTPVVFAWNKRDLPGAMPVATLEEAVNQGWGASFETSAASGQGVLEPYALARTLALAQRD